MSAARRANFQRLLRPRHIAVLGGRDAEIVIGECRRIGYRGAVWPVNPNRDEIGGYACHASLQDLPETPDAAYVAIPRDAAVAAVRQLRDMGTGGVVCYSAGFGETGPNGAAAEAALVEAAGDMALIGPNCYGLINYVDKVALWPFAHGGASPGHGAAIITQSGMLSSDLTMSQRSLPFAYMVSAGNQAGLGLEDFVDLFSEEEPVRAIGLHIEGLRDVGRFEAAALKALERGVPVVALKTGSSRIGAALAVSHTGSLSGTDELYDALFGRLGVIRVASPAQLLETLKFICIAGVPAGTRVAGFTCSGGGAAMLADHGEELQLKFPEPVPGTAKALEAALPEIATVSNPLDYTTPIWGNEERVRAVMETMLADGHDAAIAVQDYPLPGLDESKPHYLADARAFAAATGAAGLPAAICSTLPENIDPETRDFLAANGVAPMQGINEALEALAGAAKAGAARHRILADRPAPLRPGTMFEIAPLDEWRGKQFLADAGIAVPEGRLCNGAQAPGEAERLGFPVALKMVGERLAHKSEAGAVLLSLGSREAVGHGVEAMRRTVPGDVATDAFLVERMAGTTIAELLVSVRTDPQFGLAMTIASGGVLVELVADVVTVLLPASTRELARALGRLKASRLIDGYRGGASADTGKVIATLDRIAKAALAHADTVAEIEINPLFVTLDGCVAVDVLMQVRADAPGVSA